MTSERSTPSTLLFIVGPPAVGKMTVGTEIARRTGLKLYHNHLAIEPVLRFFDFGTPAFSRLVASYRQQLFDEIAASDLPGMIFTYVWAFDLPEDRDALDGYAAPFRARGARILYLELTAAQDERLRRNGTEFRLSEKPSKRDLAWSRENLLSMDRQYRLNSTGELDDHEGYLRIDNTEVSPGAVAEIAIERFRL